MRLDVRASSTGCIGKTTFHIPLLKKPPFKNHLSKKPPFAKRPFDKTTFRKTTFRKNHLLQNHLSKKPPFAKPPFEKTTFCISRWHEVLKGNLIAIYLVKYRALSKIARSQFKEHDRTYGLRSGVPDSPGQTDLCVVDGIGSFGSSWFPDMEIGKGLVVL